ncbi:major facilitator superfamily transporter [Colletotrichum karsti]|uniref:Major facilitator superfamily transporter n=1 Tax=Colletotrichum karsti TaxID=1095194 RepID=A0A9P6LLD6_9PEZI|nr:major facilitator superfamily transporter [Colletotrichum karsti]KAF9877111.1 major facilitator superfamily transporter [Colletotrichum karsti]
MSKPQNEAVIAASPVDFASIVASWSPEERADREKKLVRKMDWRLLPILIIVYIMNYIDRNAVPHARVQGLEKDLNMSGYEYNIVLSVTFVGYISMQIPSNMILTKVRPSWYLSGCMVAWGIVSGLSGAVHNFAGLAVNRFFLGVTEAPFFVGCAFLFSGWYTRRELGFRLGLLYSAAMISGAFGGLFAAGIAAAFANNRLESWRWLFIIEGIATVVFAVVCAFIIPDWPSNTKWLSPEEKAIAVMRIIEDAGEEEEDISTGTAFKLAAKDYRVWLCFLGQTCLQAVASLTNFLPTLVQNFGYSTIHTLLLTSPPYIFTALFCLSNTWWSDRTSKRSTHIIFPSAVALVGIIITLATTNTGARYFALFLMLPGTYGCFQISNAWMANIAARPQKKRAIALAANNSIGNLALVWTPYLYPASAGPRYTAAWSVNLVLMVITIVSTIVLAFFLRRCNRRAETERNGINLEHGQGDYKDNSAHIEDSNGEGDHVTPVRGLPVVYQT